jgi:hypothetical protein
MAPGSSRKIGGGLGSGAPSAMPGLRPWPVTGWLLKGFGVAFVWPLLLALLRGSFREAGALVATIALLFVAGNFVARGWREQAMNAGRTLALSPLPWRLFGAGAVGIAAFLASFGPSHDSLAMALLFGVLTAGACALTYGLDPRADRAAIEEAAKRAGVKGRAVVEALDEAYRKVRGIEEVATGLRSRELRARLERITTQARTILGQLEHNPKDLSRARRFLVTYLDGTQEVVGKYAEQQHDLADTPLDANFRQVLGTIEQVFGEQEALLRRDERLDLEVKIEVLETQLKREGIH